MINLLPDQEKTSLHYARKNAYVIRWVFALSIAIIGVFIIIFFGQVYITQATDQLKRDIERSEQNLSAQNITEVQTRVQEISNSLNLVVQVLSEQVLFSRLIQEVGSVIPEGAVLTGLTINEIEGGIDLSANATDYDTATQVQVNLEDLANQIFTTADILNVSCASEPPEGERYPCQINLRALFGENSRFLLIPANGDASQPATTNQEANEAPPHNNTEEEDTNDE